MKKVLILFYIVITTSSLSLNAKLIYDNLATYQCNLEDSINNYLEKEEFILALPLIEKHLNVVGQMYGHNSIEYAVDLSNAADVYSLAADINNAIRLAEQSLKLKKSLFGENHIEYAISLDNLGCYYDDIGDFEKAIEFHNKALNIFFNQEGVEGKNYIICLCNIISTCISNNKLDKLDIFKISIFESFNALTENASWLMENLANSYVANDRIQDALQIYREWLNSTSRMYGENSLAHASTLKYFSEKCFEIGEYSIAIEFAIKASDVYKNLYGENHEEYIFIKMSLPGYYFYDGKYSEAIIEGEKVVDLIKKVYGKYNPNYAIALDNLSRFYSQIGNYNKAIECSEEAQRLFVDKNSIDYAISVSNLAGIYHGIGNVKKALDLELVSHAIISKLNINGNYQNNYIISSYALSTYYRENQQIEEARRYGIIALDLAQKVYGENHPILIGVINNVAMCYFELKEYDCAIQYMEQSIKIIKNTLGTSHPDYVQSLYNLALISYYDGGIDFAIESILEFCSLYRTDLKSNISFLTSNERSYFVNKRKPFSDIILILAMRHQIPQLIIDCYNSILLSKGIILNADIEFASLLAESGDEEVNALYSELQQKRRYLNKLYEMPIAERQVDTEAIEKETETLERELVQKSKVYGDFTRNLAIDWKQVQSALKDDDIAIEFVSFPTESDSIMYCALTLKKGYDSPRMIALFEAKQLSAFDPVDYYDTPEISNLVWQPLTEELSDVKNIYFAPAGELYNIAIESLKDFEGEGYMFDRWNLSRLSSTRELVLRREEKNAPNVALYGGIEYKAEDFVFEQSPITDQNNYYATTRSLPDSIGLRAGKGYLWHTLIEVEQIDSLYSHKSIPAQLYTGLVGSETSLKRLSGKKLSNLHISTHGFYWSESEVNSDEDLHHLKFLHQDDTPRLVEDKAMTRSGLLFAGANAVLQGEEIPEGCDDGILTAQEIAALDFRGLDLLVLSACQTGLGEIKGDGVFGLQRGFKKAGVQSIVMSLWEVPDEATQILMTEFYENYLSGKSKRESLLNAQKAVRETPGFEDPENWAGFILLDGLN